MNESKARANKSLIGCIILACMIFATISAMSNYLMGLSLKFSASVGNVVLMFSIASIAAMAGNFILSFMFKKLKIRTIIRIGAVCFGGFFLISGLANSLALFYAGAVCFGLSQSFCGFAVIQPVLTWWFASNTGKKMSYVSIGYSLFTMVLSPVLAKLIASLGVSSTLYSHGAFCFIMLLVASFLISERPETYGLSAYSAAVKSNATETPKPASAPQGMTRSEALKYGPYWLIVVACFAGTFMSASFNSNASAMYQSLGLTSAQAATMISVYSGVGIIWTYAYGALTDKKTARVSSLIFACISAIVCAAAVVFTGLVGGLFIAIMFGVVKFTGNYAAMNLPRIVGLKEFGSIMALSNVFISLGGTLGSAVVGKLYDATGSYSSVLILYAAMFAIMAVAHFIGTKKKA